MAALIIDNNIKINREFTYLESFDLFYNISAFKRSLILITPDFKQVKVLDCLLYDSGREDSDLIIFILTTLKLFDERLGIKTDETIHNSYRLMNNIHNWYLEKVPITIFGLIQA